MESFFKLAGGTATNKIASKCFGIFCNNPGEDDKGKFTDKNSVAFVPADTTTVCGKGKVSPVIHQREYLPISLVYIVFALLLDLRRN